MTYAPTDEQTAEILEIYRETIEPLYRFVARRAGGVRELAEDVTQETYLRAVTHWRKRRPQEPLAWLQTVARNLLINHYRRRRPEPVAPHCIDTLLTTGQTDGVDTQTLVCWGLAQLRRRHAQLLEAFYLEGKATRVIAAELSLSERAVEGRLRRARAALRKQLTPHLNDNGD